MPGANQQAFGAALLAAHVFVLFPSAVSKLSRNFVFEPGAARGRYRLCAQQRLVDTRLDPPSA
jgi:RES domain-containing protein